MPSDLAEAQEAVKMGADGIGLLRTEFLFLDRAEPPTEEEHLAEYLAITGALGDRSLIIRTLDLGGDKLPSYFPQFHEDNPSLGIRGVRLALERPDLYRDQLRAILRIGSRGRYRINAAGPIFERPASATAEDATIAQHLVDAFGGSSNVQLAETVAVTRLRFVLRDGRQADEEALKRTGLTGVMKASENVWHIIAGQRAPAITAALQLKLNAA